MTDISKWWWSKKQEIGCNTTRHLSLGSGTHPVPTHHWTFFQPSHLLWILQLLLQLQELLSVLVRLSPWEEGWVILRESKRFKYTYNSTRS